jgi:hypothetical protein
MNSFINIPEDVINKILEYNIENNLSGIVTKKDLINSIKEIIKFKLLFKNSYKKNIICKYNKLIYFFKKYSEYQKNYEYHLNNSIKKKDINPLILDLLFTECTLPKAYSTYDTYNDHIFKDLKEIIKLIPNLINTKFGLLRCRYNVTPIYAACINESIPVKVIEYLLKKKPKIEKIYVNGEQLDILDDLQNNISIERYDHIIEIFKKYNNDEINLNYSSSDDEFDINENYLPIAKRENLVNKFSRLVRKISIYFIGIFRLNRNIINLKDLFLHN